MLHILEALLDLATYLFLCRILKIDLVKEGTVLISDEVEHFALSERRDLVAVLTMAIEEPIDFDVTIE